MENIEYEESTEWDLAEIEEGEADGGGSPDGSLSGQFDVHE